MKNFYKLSASGLAIVFAFLFATTVHADLVAHWWLQEGTGTTAINSADGAFNGTSAGSGIQWEAVTEDANGNRPLQQFAVRFNGSAFIDTAYPGIGGASPRTVSAWIRLNNGTLMGDILGYGAPANGLKWHFRVNPTAGNGVVGAIRTEYQGGQNVGTDVINDGNWYHVVAVFPDGATMGQQIDHYVDGVLQGKSGGDRAINTDIGEAANRVTIGKSQQGATARWYQGLIADVRIYDHALSQGEIDAIRSEEPPEPLPTDEDGDGVPDFEDNCISITNPDQADADEDGVGDACDNCPNDVNPDQADRDGDRRGNACDPSILADSTDDWDDTGENGTNNWTNGYYNLTADEDGSYSPDDFTAFTEEHWRGSFWRLVPSNAPWTTIGRADDPEFGHPNGVNSAPNEEHWAVRRWTSNYAGDVFVTTHLRAQNTNGTGTGYRLYHNGTLIGMGNIAGNDATGITQKHIIVDVQEGDTIDMALTPVGDTGDRSDGADGSFFRLSIDSFEAPEVPSLSTTGIIIMTSMFLFLAAWMLRRKEGQAIS